MKSKFRGITARHKRKLTRTKRKIQKGEKKDSKDYTTKGERGGEATRVKGRSVTAEKRLQG